MEGQDPLRAARAEIAARVQLQNDRDRQERERLLSVVRNDANTRYVDFGLIAAAVVVLTLISGWPQMRPSPYVFAIAALLIQLLRIELRLNAASKLIIDLMQRTSFETSAAGPRKAAG